MSVPRGWTVKSLHQLTETALGKMLDRGKSRELIQVPYLRNVNVQWGRIDTSDLYTMELADNERERFRVRAGDLLVCEGGEVGRAAIWNGREEYLAYQKALHRVRSRGAVQVGATVVPPVRVVGVTLGPLPSSRPSDVHTELCST